MNPTRFGSSVREAIAVAWGSRVGCSRIPKKGRWSIGKGKSTYHTAEGRLLWADLAELRVYSTAKDAPLLSPQLLFQFCLFRYQLFVYCLRPCERRPHH